MSYKFDALVSILNLMEGGALVTPVFIRAHYHFRGRLCYQYP